MKKFKNKIAALVCAIVMLFCINNTSTAENVILECYSISVTACGSHFETTVCGKDMTIIDALGYAAEYIAILCE